MNATTTDIAAFQIGQYVSARSLCDWDIVFGFTVVARTAKFVTLADDHRTYRVGVKVYAGREYALPFGNYSMAPIVYAPEK